MATIFQMTVWNGFFSNDNIWIPIKISLKFLFLKVQLAWCRLGGQPLSELMMVRLPAHICIPRPQWVLTHWSWDKMATISQTMFSNAFFLLNENVWILLKISLKFVPKDRINIIPSLVQIMAWRRPGDKSLSEPMMVSLLTHICVAGPQWVNNSPHSI